MYNEYLVAKHMRKRFSEPFLSVDGLKTNLLHLCNAGFQKISFAIIHKHYIKEEIV